MSVAPGKPKKNNRFRWMAVGAALAVLAGLTAWAVPTAQWLSALWHEPYQGYLEGPARIRVAPGSPAGRVAGDLAAAGVVADSRLFRLHLRWAGQDDRLQAGRYRFDTPMTMTEVADTLVAGRVERQRLTLPEGWSASRVFRALEQAGLGRHSRYMELWREPARFGLADLPSDATLEGYLLPSTYDFDIDADERQVITQLVETFRQRALPLLRAASPPHPLSVHELVTLASLVEREAGHADERELVASVFYNRLRLAMRLQCDPTVIYAEWLAKGEWDGVIHRSDLDRECLYNTYRRSGLPPGPICNPGLAAIRAVLDPPPTRYLFFVATNDGRHHFSVDLAGHNRAVHQFQRQGRRGGGN